ncbi:hypothetical protein U3A55_09775 [Salarchaeum sp. III]|uniref:hypothetical protein n=1 Tax=Salarchaeum sp. III TaxID=3107927 RepID=UPI002ED94D36
MVHDRVQIIFALLLLLPVAGCVSVPSASQYGAVHAENVPDNRTEWAIPASALDAPDEFWDALNEAKNASETPAYGVPERFGVTLDERAYTELLQSVGATDANHTHSFVRYEGEILKLYFGKTLLTRTESYP